MEIKATVEAKGSKWRAPSKDEILEAIEDDMVNVGISKYMWLKTLKLPEEDFDKALEKYTKEAECIAKGEDTGMNLVIKSLLKSITDDFLDEIGEDEDDAEDDGED